MVRWKEVDHKNPEFKKVLEQLEAHKLVSGYEVACDVEKSLIQLMDAFCLALLKFEGGLSDAKQIYAPPVLAAQLEEWFADYSAAWRKKNKESELNRIREVIQYLCDYLRCSIY